MPLDQREIVDFVTAAAERQSLVKRLPHAGGTGFTGGAPDVAPSHWSCDPDKNRSYVALAPESVLEVTLG